MRTSFELQCHTHTDHFDGPQARDPRVTEQSPTTLSTTAQIRSITAYVLLDWKRENRPRVVLYVREHNCRKLIEGRVDCLHQKTDREREREREAREGDTESLALTLKNCHIGASQCGTQWDLTTSNKITMSTASKATMQPKESMCVDISTCVEAACGIRFIRCNQVFIVLQE